MSNEINKKIEQFKNEIAHIISHKELNLIKDLASSDNYSDLTTEQKDRVILSLAFTHLSFNPTASEPFVKYLVFDYKVSEELYHRNFPFKSNQTFEQLFKIRKLNEDLSAELDCKNPLSNPKTIKI